MTVYGKWVMFTHSQFYIYSISPSTQGDIGVLDVKAVVDNIGHLLPSTPLPEPSLLPPPSSATTTLDSTPHPSGEGFATPNDVTQNGLDHAMFDGPLAPPKSVQDADAGAESDQASNCVTFTLESDSEDNDDTGGGGGGDDDKNDGNKDEDEDGRISSAPSSATSSSSTLKDSAESRLAIETASPEQHHHHRQEQPEQQCLQGQEQASSSSSLSTSSPTSSISATAATANGASAIDSLSAVAPEVTPAVISSNQDAQDLEGGGGWGAEEEIDLDTLDISIADQAVPEIDLDRM